MRKPSRTTQSLAAILTSFLVLILLISAVSAATQPARGTAQEPFAQSEPTQVANGILRLQQDTGGTAAISRSSATGVASFVRFTAPAALDLNQADARAAGNPEAQSAAFFAQYGEVFGVTNPAAELNLVNTRAASNGLASLTYQQVYQGVDVYAGVLKSHFNRAGQLTAVNGAFIPDLALSVTPNHSPESAANTAVAAVAAQHGLLNTSSDLTAVDARLVIFREGLTRGVSGANHLAYEFEVANSAISIREFIFVDAHTGKVIDQITGIYHGLDREVSETSLSNLIWDESAGHPDPITSGWAGGTAQQVTDWQNEIDGAAESYNVFASMSGGAYLSYDGADATMRTVNNDPGIACPNANWNGTSTNYCSGVTGDDTVAHEWGHAYTEYSNNLIYQWQSGALNESYSDIWGEVVDFINGRGTDTPLGLRTAGGCSDYGSGAPKSDNSYRWLSGEDDPAFGGAIRDMWNPTCYSDPGKVTDSQYVCSTADSGGVHSNSGVPNHAFALMVDGGTYNGRTVSGIGLTKAAHIHWAAQNMLTPSSNFVDHADALETACGDLTGINLNALSASSSAGVPSGEIISGGDCAAVVDAIAAVEFRTEPTQCGFTTLLDPDAPALCSAGETISTIALDDFESGLGWTTGTRAVANQSTFDTPDWAAVGSLPAGSPAGSTQAAFVADLIIGDCSADDESGVLYMDSPVMNIPAGASPKLAFDHWVATELGWDGGNLKASVNGGAWQQLPSSSFTFNGYNANLSSAIQGNTNPLAGQAAFTGTDGGLVGGSWGQSQVDLSGLASGGDSVRLRYEFGIDGCNGVVGWYVDNVHTYSCELPVGEMHVSDIQVTKLSQGPNRSAQALVTVVDQNDNPLASVTVDGTFTGPTAGTSGSDSGATGANGVATLVSPKEKRVSGEWSFCVDDLSFGAWTYDAAANVETCDGTDAPPAIGTVTGVVRDATNGVLIKGANVSADTGQSDTTGTDGSYSLTNVPAGSRTISASADDYASADQVTSVTDGVTSTVDFALSSQEAAVMHIGDLDGSSSTAARKRWSAAVTITVHDASENPVADAVVSGSWSSGASGSGTCTTGDAGQCSITKGNLKANASSVTFTVNNVTRNAGDSYSGVNHDPDGNNGTTITVPKPQ